MSSIAIEIALRATCFYQQEALDKSIGTCTNNRAVSIHTSNGKDIANKAIFYVKQ